MRARPAPTRISFMPPTAPVPITAPGNDPSAAAPSGTGEPSERPGFWRRRLVEPIRTQLTQGVTPNALSVAIAAGVLCGIFPVLGTTTVLTTLVAVVLRLNQPVMQSINWLIYPLQIVLIPVFIRAGEFLFRAEPIPFSIPEMLKIFSESPGGFFAEFWMTLVHCIVAWIVVVPLLGTAIALSTRPALAAAADRWRVATRSSSTPPES